VLCIGCVRVGRNEWWRQRAEVACDIDLERRCFQLCDIDERTSFFRVEADQDRHVVV
jgi:hypothetical protein